MKRVLAMKAGSPDTRGGCTKTAFAAQFFKIATMLSSRHAVARGSVESRMSDRAKLPRANDGEDQPKERDEDVSAWIGADDEKKSRENGRDKLCPEVDDDGVVEFPDREDDWRNIGVDEPSDAPNQREQSDDEAELKEPRKNREGVVEV
jgi:hypothetical protein